MEEPAAWMAFLTACIQQIQEQYGLLMVWSREPTHWMKTTLATWTPNGPSISYAPVDTSLLTPEARKY